MGKIYYMMGKSSSGKDTLFREILEEMPQLKTVTLYTTRPMREGEQDGVEYFFVAEDTLQSYEKQGKVIEQRAYETVHGIWRYATVDDGQADLKHKDYLMIGTLESYEKMRSYYGEERIVPIYIEVEDGERLMRALKRERQQETPRYAEMCRRFLADTQDFSEQNLQRLGITRRYVNQDKQQCRKEIIEDIRYGKL
ncbi:nucleoside/nucleotide kinase family protein [Dorea phocaeensis]|uniref:guanylate kinase n=1 Tax=Dorea phocaeensis TaxID=2040291 RepID=UPI000C7743F1|nr:guanylate kinase [Dorea phocaeensis]